MVCGCLEWLFCPIQITNEIDSAESKLKKSNVPIPPELYNYEGYSDLAIYWWFNQAGIQTSLKVPSIAFFEGNQVAVAQDYLVGIAANIFGLSKALQSSLNKWGFQLITMVGRLLGCFRRRREYTVFWLSTSSRLMRISNAHFEYFNQTWNSAFTT